MGLRLKHFKKHCFRSCHTDHRGLRAETLCILSEELSHREASRPVQCNSDHCHRCCAKQGNEPQAVWSGPQHGPRMPGTSDLSSAPCPAQTEKPLPTSCFLLFAGLLG